MFCEKCGNQLEDNAVFCEKCGAKLEKIENPTQPTGTKINISLKAKLLIAGGVVVAVVIAFISNYIGKTVNLNDYLEVEFSGYDTVGYASVSFDEETFEKDFGDKIEFTNKSTSSEWGAPVDVFVDYVNGDLDKRSGLSNGEEVSFIWDVDDEVLNEMFNLNVKYKDTTFEVAGLEEVTTFDPFEGVSLSYFGASPEGRAEVVIDSSNEMANNLYYELSKNYELSNGDEIVVTIYSDWYDDATEYCVSNYGMIPTSTEKTFVVDGLGEYVTTLADISDEAMAQMQQQGIDVLNAYVAKEWSTEHARLNATTYAGSVLLLPKSSNSYEHNKLYVLYEVNAWSIVK